MGCHCGVVVGELHWGMGRCGPDGYGPHCGPHYGPHRCSIMFLGVRGNQIPRHTSRRSGPRGVTLGDWGEGLTVLVLILILVLILVCGDACSWTGRLAVFIWEEGDEGGPAVSKAGFVFAPRRISLHTMWTVSAYPLSFQ